MKPICILSFAFLAANFSFAQGTDEADLDRNNINAHLSSGGIFFNQGTEPGFEAPKESGNNSIYSASFWYGGEDVAGQIKLAAQLYEPNSDLWSGPLSIGGAEPDPSGIWTMGLFTVTKAQIENFKAWYADPVAGYTVPEIITNWPAHGNVAEGQDFYLAPFVDVNGDGLYSPIEDGDYPCIPGDKATFLIMNDKKDVHGSGGDPIGLEIHYMFYQYDQVEFENVTFVNTRIINRGSQTIYDFKTSLFVDIDLGDGSDDFVGSKSDQNLMYGYNSINTDGVYGTNPPAVGAVLLNNPLESGGVLGMDAGNPLPTTIFQYLSYMNGNTLSGAPWTDAGTGDPVDFMYNGNPADGSGSSELANGNVGGDRKILMTTAEEVFEPNEELIYDYAFVFADGGATGLDNVTGLFELVQAVQEFYDINGTACSNGTVSITEEPTPFEATIYPNPSQGQFTVQLPETTEHVVISLIDMSGRIIYKQQEVNTQSINIDLNEASGTYILHIESGTEKLQHLITIQ